MANFITRGIQAGIDALAERIAGYLSPEQVAALAKTRAYFLGDQKRPLKQKVGQADDNLIVNLVGLAVHRSNSMLFGGGVDFTVPSDPAADEWLKNVWAANKKNIFLQKTGMDGELSGTPYIKIVPDGKEYKGATYPRLVLLDPLLMSIETDPMDIEQVNAYTFEMKVSDNKSIREVTRRAGDDGEIFVNENGLEEPAPAGTWVIESWVSEGRNNGQWKLVKSTPWLYPFPPIIHWQNLPSIHSVYGLDGTGGSLDIQDKYNLTLSNILKILRYHAHPKTWARGVPSNAKAEKTSWGADEMVTFTSETAMISNLEMQSDLSSSRAFAQDMRQLVFDLFRVVDVASMKDKIGALTNFGLRVLYSDALAKNATRRELYGDALLELNRRMMVLQGAEQAPDSAIVWGPDMPQDEKEDAELVLQDLAAGIASKETASTKRGYVWATSPEGVAGEKDKIAGETAANGDAANLALARLFAGTETPQ